MKKREDGIPEEGLPEVEVDFETGELGDVAGAQAKIKKLRDELKEAQAKRDEYLDGWQRCKADAINSRKDMLAEAERKSERIKMGLMEDIIPVLDSFDMAASTEAWAQVSNNWKNGMEQVRNQLLEVMARNGVERFGKIGDAFDPRFHEVIQEVEGEGEPHAIVKILRFGYSMGTTVLRPAQVFVKK